MLLFAAVLLHVQEDSFVNQRRLIIANHVHRRLLRYLRPLRSRIYRYQTRMRMDLRPRRNRRDEAQLVGPVIYDVAEPDHLPIIRVFNAGSRLRVRNPCATGPPNGLSFLQRSISMWIH